MFKVAAILIFGLIAINAVFVKKAATDPNMAVYSQLEQLEESQMGKKLLETIALQLKNKAPLADIAKMLQDLRENLILQQQDSDSKHASDESECETEIDGYNRRIEFSSNEITESSHNVGSLTNDVNQYSSDIDNKATQLDILNEQEEVLRDARATDNEAYKQRLISTPQIIEALDVIASKLGGIQPDSDSNAVLAELHRIGAGNPILALVQLASTFSADRLQSVQEKIAELRQSIQQSISDDQESETQGQIDFDTLMLQFSEQRENLSSGRQDSQRKLESSQNQLSSEKKRREDANNELIAASNGKDQKSDECESQRSQYSRETEARSSQIGIVRQIENILATKLEGASGYLKDKINA